MPSSADPNQGIMVQVQNLTFQYPENPEPSLIDISFELHPCDRVLVIGANGSGKSTLLTLLSGARKPRGNGLVRVMGADPFDVTSMAQHIAMIGSPWPPEAVFGNTVERVASPAPNPSRRQSIADALHMRLSRYVDKMSSGEKRRVQVLHGLLPEARLFLLDECSTDIDVVERKTVLDLVKQEVVQRQGCALYATHVFDGVEEWATHVALMRNGRLIQFLPVATLRLLEQQHESSPERNALGLGGGGSHGFSVEAFARDFMALGSDEDASAYCTLSSSSSAAAATTAGAGARDQNGKLHFRTHKGFLHTAYDGQYLTSLTAVSTSDAPAPGSEAFVCAGGNSPASGSPTSVLVVSPLSSPIGQNYREQPPCSPPPPQAASPRTVALLPPAIECSHLTFKDIFHDMSLSLPRGSRTLLCGCNGCGKSTLLNMLGGKQFFNNRNGALKVMGWKCYEDMRRVNELVAYGGDWWLKAPEGEVYVHEMFQITTPRARHLQELLAVDINWDVRKISSGECKRVQLLLQLLVDKPVVLLDEATADLDVDQRHRLLHFLYAESVQRGVTVVYATHIFNGLEGWPSKIALLDRTKRGLHGLWDAPTAHTNIAAAVSTAMVEEACTPSLGQMEVREIPLELAKLKAAEVF